jgi:hypothetical protein
MKNLRNKTLKKLRAKNSEETQELKIPKKS